MGRKSITGGVREERGKVRLDFRYQGQRLKPTLDLEWNERNRKHALRLVEEIKTKIRHGVFNPADYFPEYKGLARVGVKRSSAPTFGTVAESYLGTIKRLAYSTQLSYKRALDGYWLPEFKDKPITSILASDIHDVLANLEPKNRNNVLIPCRKTFAHAIADGILAISPAGTVSNAKVQKEEPDPFDLDEVRRLLADLAKNESAEAADYFEFAFFTGLRVSEQIALRWTDHDKSRGLLRVQRSRVWGKDKDVTKTHNARNVELLDQAIAVLARQRARTELAGGEIFRNPRTKQPWIDEQVQRRILDAAVKRTGIRHRSPKQTRHSFATMCLMSGCNPSWVARQLGHRSAKMLYEVYSRWIEGADKGQERARAQAWIGEVPTAKEKKR